ncbi:hypothetical protein J6590_039701 [Homalodisca vitripennis]|nr:hypothetical protein J6590_039701 [Homalodisca vitripennis]
MKSSIIRAKQAVTMSDNDGATTPDPEVLIGLIIFNGRSKGEGCDSQFKPKPPDGECSLPSITLLFLQSSRFVSYAKKLWTCLRSETGLQIVYRIQSAGIINNTQIPAHTLYIERRPQTQGGAPHIALVYGAVYHPLAPDPTAPSYDPWAVN